MRGRLIELRGKFVVFLLRRSPRKEQSASLFYGAPLEPFFKQQEVFSSRKLIEPALMHESLVGTQC